MREMKPKAGEKRKEENKVSSPQRVWILDVGQEWKEEIWRVRPKMGLAGSIPDGKEPPRHGLLRDALAQSDLTQIHGL